MTPPKQKFLSTMFHLITILLQVIVIITAAHSQDLPTIQKCESHRVPPETRVVELPQHATSGNHSLFRVVEKCATRLPHCMKPCGSPLARVTVPINETHVEADMRITKQGFFRFNFEYFSPDDFCLYAVMEDEVLLDVCPSTCDIDKLSGQIEQLQDTDSMEEDQDTSDTISEVCVPKCCSLHKVLDVKSESCENVNRDVLWAPLVYRSASRQICGEKRVNLKFHYIQSPPLCEKFHRYLLKSINGTTRVRFRLLTNGSVLLRELNGARWTVLEPGTYCLDGIMNYGGKESYFTGEPTDQILLVCLNEKEQIMSNGTAMTDEVNNDGGTRWTTTGILYTMLLFSGSPFLLVTVILYGLVWSQQNVHGWSQASHAFATLVHSLAQAVANLVSRILQKDAGMLPSGSTYLCKVVGITNHYSVLSSFCWLTIINYNLFSMFRHLQTTVGRSKGVGRFVVYMVLAWGIPLVVVIISVVLDKLFGLYGDDGDCEVDVIVPLYGHLSCYMVEDAHPYYLYYPVGILMTLNLVMAVLTFVNMYKHDQSAKMARAENKQNKHRRKFSVMSKLFVVMGLVFIFEMSVWAFKKEGETLPWYLVFPDFLNVIQAIAIFVLFACQPKILNQVENTYPKLKGVTDLMRCVSCGNGNRKGKGASGISASSGQNQQKHHHQVQQVVQACKDQHLNESKTADTPATVAESIKNSQNV